MSHPQRRGLIELTPENRELVERVTGPGELHGPRLARLILADGSCRRINGRYIVGNVLVPAPDGSALTRRDGDQRALVTKRHRFRIPAGHPWRGHTPTR